VVGEDCGGDDGAGGSAEGVEIPTSSEKRREVGRPGIHRAKISRVKIPTLTRVRMGHPADSRLAEAKTEEACPPVQNVDGYGACAGGRGRVR
jgi:hypothetical protein